jgi:hypothetical protein
VAEEHGLDEVFEDEGLVGVVVGGCDEDYAVAAGLLHGFEDLWVAFGKDVDGFFVLAAQD